MALAAGITVTILRKEADMDSLKRKQVWTIVSLAVAMFVIVAVVQYCMPMVNGREFSWGWVLTE